MQKIIKEAEDLFEQSKRFSLENNGQNYPYPCNDCHEKDIVGEKDNTAYCFLCNEIKQEKYCISCEEPLYFYSANNFSANRVCYLCTAVAGDEYLYQDL